MFRSVDNTKSDRQVSSSVAFLVRPIESRRPREFFMVDGIGSPHCADIATVGRYRQFP